MNRRRVKNILIVGDLMLDKYYINMGNDKFLYKSNKSIINVTDTFDRLGGAANVANNLIHLGCRVSVCGVLGKDQYATILEKMLIKLNINCSGIIKLNYVKTTVKIRIIHNGKIMLRLDYEDKLYNEFIQNQIINWLEQNIKFYDAIIISDYGKGVCEQNICKYIIDMAKKSEITVAVDPSGDNWEKYSYADYIMPNLEELYEAYGEKFNITNDDAIISKMALKLIDLCNIKTIIVTRSEMGCSIISKLYNDVYHIRTKKIKEVDACGAGDTFIATFTILKLLGYSIVKASFISNYAAGIVTQRFGTSTIKLSDLNIAESNFLD